MAKTEFLHMGKKVVIDSDEREIRLSIEGEPVATFPAKAKGGFYTPYLPYREYSSVAEMAKALIKHVPRFMPKGR